MSILSPLFSLVVVAGVVAACQGAVEGPEASQLSPQAQTESAEELSDAARVPSDDGLTEVSAEETGRTGLADLAGVEWVLTRFSPEEEAPAEPEITLVLAAGAISGSSGCNRYRTTLTEGETPGQVSVGQIVGTMMACPDETMKLEGRYLEALQATTHYGFLAGSLVLSWSRDEVSGALFFSSGPLEE